MPPALTAEELAQMDEAFTANVTPLDSCGDAGGFARLPPVSVGGRGYQSICQKVKEGFLKSSQAVITQEPDRVWVIETTTSLPLATLYRQLKRDFHQLQLSWSTIWAIHLHWPLPVNGIRLFFIPGSPRGAIVCENGAGPDSHLSELYPDPERSTIVCPAGYRLYLPAPNSARPLSREAGLTIYIYFLEFFNLTLVRLYKTIRLRERSLIEIPSNHYHILRGVLPASKNK